MAHRKRSTKFFVYGYAVLLLVISANILVVYTGSSYTPPSLSMVILMGVFALLTALAAYFSLPISLRTRIVVDTSVVFACALLFPPPWAGLVTAVGTLLGQILTRRRTLDWVINTAVKFIEITAAQSMYLLLGGNIPPHFQSVQLIPPLAVAIATYLFLDRFLIAVAVVFYRGFKLAHVLSENWARALKEDLALLLLGVLTALVTEVQPWALALAVIPIGLVYVSLRNSLRLEILTLEAVERMADVIDRRDPYTAGHSQRVAVLAEKIALAMGLPVDEVKTVRAAARVHDLGKIAIDASVLNKPGRLTDEEWEAMRQHPLIGAEIISRFPEFARGADYIRYHHERWDGKGYPFGLRGEEIPLGARIIAVADAYDAMRTDRPYRKALSIDVVMEEFQRGAGTYWDPDVVAAFLKVMERTNRKDDTPGVLAPAAG